MAQALQCPSCGSTTRLDGTEIGGGTIRCESCGQTMTVPPGLPRRSGRRSAAPAPAAAPASAGPAPSGSTGNAGAAAPASAAPAVAPPAPRRRSRPSTTAGGAAAGAAAGSAAVGSAAAGGTAVLAPGPARASAPAKSGDVRPAGRRGRGASDEPETLPLWLRIGVWVIALPLGLLVVGLPARQLGYLSSQKLLDVIVKRDLSRFVPIVVIVALWALVTAVLVTVMIEGGRRWRLRRRERRDRAPRAVALDDLGGGTRRRRFGRRR